MFIINLLNKLRKAHPTATLNVAAKKTVKSCSGDLNTALTEEVAKIQYVHYKGLDGKTHWLSVTPEEVESINAGHERILRKAGISDINQNPNFDRHNLTKFNDPWNPYYRG